MPELPEAETIVRGLRPTVVGRTIRSVRVVHEDVLRVTPRRFAADARGRTVEGVDRRGKNVLLRLDGGGVLAVNLGMTGRLLPFPEPPRGRSRPTHPAVVLHFQGGGVLVFDDQRRFGTVEVLGAEAWAQRDARMGPEPLEPTLTPRRFHGALGRSRSPIRSWLLDQRRIAGVGNIYAVEALHLAGIHPLRPAAGLSAAEAATLLRTLRTVLRDAIRHGGTTIRDYRNADGEEGRYARRLHAYGREGKPCSGCGAPIRRLVLSARSAYHCPACQTMPEEG